MGSRGMGSRGKKSRGMGVGERREGM